MAKFKVTQHTYRASKLHAPGEFFSCKDEDLGKHCDSIALEPADDETVEAFLAVAPESKKAKAIIAGRELAKKKAEADAKARKAAAELALKRESK